MKRQDNQNQDLPTSEWDRLDELIHELTALRSKMLELESEGMVPARHIHPSYQQSARNLLHYLALRRHDLRHLQDQLTALGLSSLGRAEAHVLSTVEALLAVLHRQESPGQTRSIPAA